MANNDPASSQYPDLPADLRWQLIKSAVVAKGETMASIGVLHGVTGVAAVKSKRYPAAQDAIAATLGASAAALFPERYAVAWSDHYQQEVEKALPGLGCGVDQEPLWEAKLKDLTERWREVPVALEQLPGTGKNRLTWIRNQLKSRGFNLTQMARHLGVDRTAINNLGVVAYADVQAFIAQCLGVRPQELWPDRYDTDGSPLSSGRTLKAAPYRDAPRSTLDLRDGLWLPIDALAGLQGLPDSVEGIAPAAKRNGWQVRDRAGVMEIAFSSLPTETRHFLVGINDASRSSPVGKRLRKRFKRSSVELEQPNDGARKVFAVEAGDGVSVITITSVGTSSGLINGWQQASLTPGELRQVAAIFLEAAQACEIGTVLD